MSAREHPEWMYSVPDARTAHIAELEAKVERYEWALRKIASRHNKQGHEALAALMDLISVLERTEP